MSRMVFKDSFELVISKYIIMIEDFIKTNFNEAISIQSGFEHDEQMVKAVQNETLNPKMVNDWMRKYGLFQGIKTEIRNKIASEYIEFAKRNRNFKPQEIQSKFQELHGRLKLIKDRKWISATSKLLWCIEPKIVVIYDAFVERAILILQCLDEELANFPRINIPPNSKNDVSSKLVAEYYMNYQNLVNCLYCKNKKLIISL